MKKILRCILITSLLVGLAGCNSSKINVKFSNENNRSLRDIKMHYEENDVDEIKLNYEELNGIEVLDDEIILTDGKENKIIFLDIETGEIKNTIGSTGNGEKEFIHPQEVAIDSKKNLYVLDSGNKRIQVLSKEHEVIENIELNVFSEMRMDTLNDIVLDDKDNIYVSVNTYKEKDARIIFINKEREIKFIGEGIVGYLAAYNEYVYFVSFGEFYEDAKRYGYRAGTNCVYRMKYGEVVDGFYLPQKYCPESITINDETILVKSFAFARVDKFDFEGKYIETLFIDEDLEKSELRNIATDKNGNIYIVDRLSKSIKIIKSQ